MPSRIAASRSSREQVNGTVPARGEGPINDLLGLGGRGFVAP